MSLYFQATMRRVWAKRGQTPTLRIATQRQSTHFYGALNLLTGQQLALPALEQTCDMTCHFLTHLCACYPHRPLLILWDRAKWHKGRGVQDFLALHPAIQTFHFPPGSPHLNPQEHVGACSRDAISHNHTFKDFPALVRAFHQYLENTLFHFNWLEKYAPPHLCGF